jgi:hypothetical protein
MSERLDEAEAGTDSQVRLNKIRFKHHQKHAVVFIFIFGSSPY